MAGKQQVTWGGRFEGGPSALMQRFSESVSFDARLAPYDIAGSRAHARMLREVGLLSREEQKAIDRGLREIGAEIAAGTFAWKAELEDVHMNIEQALTGRVPAAAKLHTARSRNDQVATDMRLFIREACGAVDEALQGVMRALLEWAGKVAEARILIPGYTHLQRAQPVPMAHHLLAYLEMYERDRGRFAAVSAAAGWCPLGAGALAGTTLPIDRELAAAQLGFLDGKGNPQVTGNSMDAVADRDLFLDFAGAAATCGIHLSRLAEDWILWSSQEFGFIRLPEAFTTGSSLMPQKKNPDALELIRGKSGRLVGNLQALLTLCKGLPLTYNRDLQEDKIPVFDSCDQLLACLEVLAAMTPGIEVREDRCAAAVADPLLLATDLADYLVERGMPFREAHHAVGALVRRAEEVGCPLDRLEQAEAEGVAPALGAEWREVFSLERAMDRRTGTGMPGWKPLRKQLKRWKARLEPEKKG